MKKKLLSIILCLCICFSFLTGCSLFVTDESYKDDDIVMTVGNTQIKREELVNQYNNFYSQYYQYFMYYDASKMMDLFYSAVEGRAVILEKANELLDRDTIKFYQEDWDDIWNNIYDFINAQLDTYEKAILLQSGVKDEDLPKRLVEEDESETAYVYKEYVAEDEKLKKPDYTKDADAEPSFADKYNYLKSSAIYTYNAETDENEDRDTQNIPEAEKVARTTAYNMYIENLSLAAKATGKDYNLDSVLTEEVERLYKTYYESALYTKYQEYFEGGIIDEGLLSDDAIVSKFIELTNKDTQNNANEDNYIKVVTSTDTESLILYHNSVDGNFTYFTVQHILVKFDNVTSEELKQHVGYLSTVDSIYRNEYEGYRQALVSALTGTDLNGTSVSGIDAMQTSYRDNEGYLVKETVGTGEDAKEVLVKVTVSDILADFDAQVDALGAGATERDISMIFNKLAWKYSNDTGSLTEKLSGKLGFTISNEVDNHGSFVVDFTNGARNLFAEYENGNKSVGKVLTDYGLHLMLVTGKYEAGQLVDVVNTAGNGYRDFDEIAAELKTTYVSNMTEQTLYDYIYDILKAELVGESGTYFTDYKNDLISNYKENNKINYVEKMTQEELSRAIGA